MSWRDLSTILVILSAESYIDHGLIMDLVSIYISLGGLMPKQHPSSSTGKANILSLRWGCQTGLKQYVLTLPVGCNLTIIGEYAFQERARKTIRFQPILIQLVGNMRYVDLGDQFKGLDSITFITQYDLGLNGATSFDDFSYTINR